MTRPSRAGLEDPQELTLAKVSEWLAFVGHSLGRHPWLCLLAFSWALLLSVGLLFSFPATYRISSSVLAQRNPLIGQIVNPGRRGVAEMTPPTHDVGSVVYSTDNLLAIGSVPEVFSDWARSRPALLRLKDWLQRKVTGKTVTPEAAAATIAGMLERRLYVESHGEVVDFTLDWPDPSSGKRIVAEAVRRFVEAREAAETSTVASAIGILDKHIAELEQRLEVGPGDSAAVGDVDSVKLRLSGLRGQVEDAQLEAKAVQVSFAHRFEVLRPPAIVGEGPLKPRSVEGIIGALIGGILLALLGAVVIDLRDPHVLEEWQVRRTLGLPILGEVDGAAARRRTDRASLIRWALWVVPLGLLSALLTGLTGGLIVAGAVPTLVVAVAFLVARSPLRWTVFTLLFLWLALDGRTDAMGLWHTPLYPLGDFFNENLGNTVGVAALKISGQELTLFALIGLLLYRKSVGSRIDRAGQVQTAGVLGDFILVWLAAVLFSTVNGLLHGARTEVVIWHLRPLISYVLIFAVCQEAFRGPKDHRTLGRIVVAAAFIKACYAVWVWNVVRPAWLASKAEGATFEYSTNHGESVLFASAVIVLLVSLIEAKSRKKLAATLVALGVILFGIHCNNRRLAWIEISMASAAIYLITPMARRWKRTVTRSLLMLVPVVALYIGAGWNNTGSSVFKPVGMLRSIADSKSDRSTLDRDVENWNLLLSMRERPILGRGFGFEYTEYWLGDDISKAFPMYKAIPHNSVLALLLFAGLVGFCGLWSLLAVGVFLAVRSFHRTTVGIDRAAAMAAVGVVLIVVLHIYGDMGISSNQSRVLLPMALAVAGKLAVATGAWPERKRKISSLARTAAAAGSAPAAAKAAVST